MESETLNKTVHFLETGTDSDLFSCPIDEQCPDEWSTLTQYDCYTKGIKPYFKETDSPLKKTLHLLYSEFMGISMEYVTEVGEAYERAVKVIVCNPNAPLTNLYLTKFAGYRMWGPPGSYLKEVKNKEGFVCRVYGFEYNKGGKDCSLVKLTESDYRKTVKHKMILPSLHYPIHSGDVKTVSEFNFLELKAR